MGRRPAPSLLWACLAALWLPGVALAQVGTNLEAEFADEYDAPPEPTAPPVEPAAAPEPEPAAPLAISATTTATTTSVTTTTASSDSSADEPKPRVVIEREEQLLRAHNTWQGPVGGVHVVDAGSGLLGSMRLQIGLDFFQDSDYLSLGDDNSFVGGTLSLSATLTDYFELFASVANHANANTGEQPELLQVLGDTLLGAKAFHRALPWLTLGGDMRLVFLNSVGDIGVALEGTSVGLRGNLSMDLRELKKPVPLQLRFGLDYFFDNSANLIEDVEASRYAALPADRREINNEDRHLLSRVERFALGINRTDAFTLALGLEAPLRAAEDFYIHPILEWQLSVPVNRQDYNCLVVPGDGSVASPDGCLDLEGVSAMPSTLTLAVRILPPVRGLSFALGADIGLLGVTTFVRELSPNRPHAVLLAMSYAVDTAARGDIREVEVVREVEAAPEPPNPRIAGIVVEQGSDRPVPRAIVRYLGTDLTQQATADDGSFLSYEFEPGEVRMQLSHPDYEGRDCLAQIPAPEPQPEPGTPVEGEDPEDARAAEPTAPRAPDNVEVRCELEAKPRHGKIRGQVLDPDGNPIDDARVQLTGPSAQDLVSSAGGRFDVESALPGDYQVRAEHDDYLIRLASFTLTPSGTANPQLVLVKKPKKSQVTLTQKEVRIRKRIFFKSASAEIDDKSNTLLSEIADVLIRNPQVTRVEVQGHTDNRGGSELNTTLSQARAESVRDWLLGAGIHGSRLTAKGYGDARPLVPNITAGNRARNRRVQFIIQAQPKDDEAPKQD